MIPLASDLCESVWQRGPLNLRDRAALMALAGSACGKSGVVEMSYNGIAKAARISRWSAIRAVSELAARPDAWVIADGSSCEAGAGGVNRYRLNLERLGLRVARVRAASSLWPGAGVPAELLGAVPVPDWLTAWRCCPERAARGRLIRCAFSSRCPDCGGLHDP